MSEGINPSLSNEFGNTPLHLACSIPTAAYLDLILNASTRPPIPTSVSSPNITRGHMRSPLSTSPLSSSSSSSVVPLYGANSQTSIIPPLTTFMNKPNTKGNTALHLACFYGNLEAVKVSLIVSSSFSAVISFIFFVGFWFYERGCFL